MISADQLKQLTLSLFQNTSCEYRHDPDIAPNMGSVIGALA